ncbi:MAG: GlsB/YeaQ/YmgE family stress response rane protein [Fibrobacteres bacterium]|nr:GlsB/YeaQ/YmgE family stress response rane protein [Fibrobacterota bacterium]
MLEFIWFLAVGAIAGYSAGALSGFRRFGLAGDMVIGVVGSFLGGYLLAAFANKTGDLSGSVTLAVLGAIIVLALANLATRPKPLR